MATSKVHNGQWPLWEVYNGHSQMHFTLMYCSMVLFKCDELHCVIKWTNVNCRFLCQDGRYGCGRFDL